MKMHVVKINFRQQNIYKWPSLRRKLSLVTFSFPGVYDETIHPQLYFVCGLAAGSIAAVVTQPADVIKTHMQTDSKKYKRIMSTVLQIYQVRRDTNH